jgi:hypothetical protein
VHAWKSSPKASTLFAPFAAPFANFLCPFGSAKQLERHTKKLASFFQDDWCACGPFLVWKTCLDLPPHFWRSCTLAKALLITRRKNSKCFEFLFSVYIRRTTINSKKRYAKRQRVNVSPRQARLSGKNEFCCTFECVLLTVYTATILPISIDRLVSSIRHSPSQRECASL